jgi:hypothetical protein
VRDDRQKKNVIPRPGPREARGVTQRGRMHRVEERTNGGAPSSRSTLVPACWSDRFLLKYGRDFEGPLVLRPATADVRPRSAGSASFAPVVTGERAAVVGDAVLEADPESRLLTHRIALLQRPGSGSETVDSPTFTPVVGSLRSNQVIGG